MIIFLANGLIKNG